MNTAEISETIIALQVKRKWAIKLAIKLKNSTRSLARRYCGFRWDIDETERAKVSKRAAGIVDRALAGKEQLPNDADIASVMVAELKLLELTLGPVEDRRNVIEKEMVRLAKQLPVYPWAKAVAGLGEIGLAVTVGEAGDISKYPNIRHLWKRLGLAPYEGRAMSNWHGNELNADEWTAAGYSSKRRAEIFACVGESLGKHQLGSAAKAGTDFSVAKGPYGEIYVARRNHCLTTHPDWSRGHLHGDAMRVMTKAVLKDIWREWNREEGNELDPDRWAELPPGSADTLIATMPMASAAE